MATVTFGPVVAQSSLQNLLIPSKGSAEYILDLEARYEQARLENIALKAKIQLIESGASHTSTITD